MIAHEQGVLNMSNLYFATTNAGKISSMRREIKRLKKWKVLTMPFDVPEPRGEDIVEIAVAKVRYAQNIITKTGVVALDAGFYIKSLNGFPGAIVNPILRNPSIGIRGILKLMNEYGAGHRSCKFMECVAFLDPELAKEPLTFSAEIPGELAYEPRGTMQKHLWSPLAMIFMPKGENGTLAEMNKAEYEDWRRRREKSAIKLFVDWLKQF